MNSATFIGIDLAWKSERNPSGAAILKGSRDGADLQTLETLHSMAEVTDFVRSNATASTVVAIDAPLIILNKTGQRACETEVGRRYGNRDASCHTSNMKLYPDAASVALAAALVADGFVHPKEPDMEPSGRIVFEVYPRAAMVALWDLKKSIKYKKGTLGTRRIGLRTVRNYLNDLSHAKPALVSRFAEKVLERGFG